MKAGVSHNVISLVERGHLERVTLRNLRRVARELDAEFRTTLWWRAGDLDRLADEAHASLVGRVATLLGPLGWQVRIEVSYSIYGERGSIDVLAWHGPTRALLVVEVKTELTSIEETLRRHDAKARLAPRIARSEIGWHAAHVARLLVLPGHATARRRVARSDAVLGHALPMRGSELRSWLRQPIGPAAGILFVDDRSTGPRRVGSTGRRRIRAASAPIRQTPRP
jgi:hypothetical protein